MPVQAANRLIDKILQPQWVWKVQVLIRETKPESWLSLSTSFSLITSNKIYLMQRRHIKTNSIVWSVPSSSVNLGRRTCHNRRLILWVDRYTLKKTYIPAKSLIKMFLMRSNQQTKVKANCLSRILQRHKASGIQIRAIYRLSKISIIMKRQQWTYHNLNLILSFADETQYVNQRCVSSKKM